MLISVSGDSPSCDPVAVLTPVFRRYRGEMDQGALLRTAREAARVSLRSMARMTNYSPAYLSLIESGKRPASHEVVCAYERTLGMDLERLAAVSDSPAKTDSSSLDDVAVMLSATRRIEDAVGPASVLTVVQGMSTMTERFADQARSRHASRAAALASEVTQYRGWLEHATGAGKASLRSLDRSIALAEHACGSDQLAHGLSFSAYVRLERGRLDEAAQMVDAVLSVPRLHPLIRVYERYQHARVLAVAGDRHGAERALLLADSAADAAADEPPPDAGYWYTPGFFGLQHARVLRTLGETERSREVVAQSLESMPEDHRTAEWAAKWRRAAAGDDDVPH
ncbi:helix-turn-helix domain-containing protein [Nocardia sp. NPDC047654]|uniref:helix-turn-helix domain-containing protein n=1 Tax=Nocardia sp. NPDC047654 TaxID=3364314 RepID=UPI00371D0068